MTPDTGISDIKTPKGSTKAFVFSLLTLLSGIIIGSGLTLMFKGPAKEPAPPALPEEFSRRMVDHLTRELNLTQQQADAIRPVVESHMKVIDTYREEARPKIRTELDTMNDEILSILDEQQKHIWQDKITRMQQRFQKSRRRREKGDWRKDGQRRGDGPPPDDDDRDRQDWRPERPDGDPNNWDNFPPPPKPEGDEFEPGMPYDPDRQPPDRRQSEPDNPPVTESNADIDNR